VRDTRMLKFSSQVEMGEPYHLIMG